MCKFYHWRWAVSNQYFFFGHDEIFLVSFIDTLDDKMIMVILHHGTNLLKVAKEQLYYRL